MIGGQSAAGIPPGQAATFTFTTAAAYPNDPANDALFVSATCLAGSDRQAEVTGPRTPVAPPPDDGPKTKPCKCKKMSVKLDRTLVNKAPEVAPDDHDFGVGFQWFMTCSAGKGKCTGTVNFSPPEILAGELPEPAAEPQEGRVHLPGPVREVEDQPVRDQDALARAAPGAVRADARLHRQDEVRRRDEDDARARLDHQKREAARALRLRRGGWRGRCGGPSIGPAR